MFDQESTDLKVILPKEYDKIIASAITSRDWYTKKRVPTKRGSRGIRILSLFFASLGGLMPLLGSIEIFNNLKFLGGSTASWGYVFFALAAAALLFDRFFGYSTAWMRFMLAELELDRAIKEFEFDWKRQWTLFMTENDELNSAKFNELLGMLKNFSISADNIVKTETEGWVTEFSNNLSDLHKLVKSELEATKPGSLSLIVKNATEYDKVEIKVDGVQKRVMESDSVHIQNLNPGGHEIVVVGEYKGAVKSTSCVVNIETKKMYSAELELPTLTTGV